MFIFYPELCAQLILYYYILMNFVSNIKHNVKIR